MPGEIVLVTGGVRSGKSRFAAELAGGLAGESSRGSVTFIATACISDADAGMADRIARHRTLRPAKWRTVEAPIDLELAIREAADGKAAVALVDCLTLWVSNLLLRVGDVKAPGVRQAAEKSIAVAVSDLVKTCRRTCFPIVIVTGEVGSGVAPTTVLGNLFADALGLVNQEVSAAADRVYLLTAGIAQRIK